MILETAVGPSQKVQSFTFPAANEVEKKNEVARSVKAGDIVFTKFTGKTPFTAKMDGTISVLQRVVRKIQRKKDTQEMHRITHTAVVVKVDEQRGRILVAEAMPTKKKNELRVIDLLSDHSMVLTAKEPFEYHILRMDAKRAGTQPCRAAEIAESLSTPASYLLNEESQRCPLKPHRFSYREGFIAIFCNGASRCKTEGFAKRLFEKVADEHFGSTAGYQRVTPKSFFCSYFATYVYQQAEVASHFDQIKELKGVKEGLEAIQEMPEGRRRTLALNRWTARMAKEHRTAISSMVKTFALDPKYTSPDQLMDFLKRDDLFRLVVRFVPHPNPIA